MRNRPGLRRMLSVWCDERPGWMRAAAEVILLVLVLVAFSRIHAAIGTDVVAATDNAHALQAMERHLHLDIELATNRWLTGHGGLILPAVLVYRLYYTVLVGVLVWIFLRRTDVYRYVRRIFIAMTGLALVVYWAVPMSPPRFALAGIADIVAEHDLPGGHEFRELHSFSAMPSLHVGWSAWAAYAAWYALRRAHPRAALLAWLFPILMVADVFATGNHYVLDVVGSALLLVASIAVARGWARLVDRRHGSPTSR